VSLSHPRTFVVFHLIERRFEFSDFFGHPLAIFVEAQRDRYIAQAGDYRKGRKGREE
jgi:hypothetical protein